MPQLTAYPPVAVSINYDRALEQVRVVARDSYTQRDYELILPFNVTAAIVTALTDSLGRHPDLIPAAHILAARQTERG
jgi:hypothetical protein